MENIIFFLIQKQCQVSEHYYRLKSKLERIFGNTVVCLLVMRALRSKRFLGFRAGRF